MTKSFDKLYDRPIIGVTVVMPDHERMGKYFFPAVYVKNVEASGARVASLSAKNDRVLSKKCFKF